MGPVQICSSSQDFAMTGLQSSHSVHKAWWQAKMASIEIWIPWHTVHRPHNLLDVLRHTYCNNIHKLVPHCQSHSPELGLGIRTDRTQEVQGLSSECPSDVQWCLEAINVSTLSVEWHAYGWLGGEIVRLRNGRSSSPVKLYIACILVIQLPFLHAHITNSLMIYWIPSDDRVSKKLGVTPRYGLSSLRHRVLSRFIAGGIMETFFWRVLTNLVCLFAYLAFKFQKVDSWCSVLTAL